MRAMVMNTPPLNAFATPNTLGDSLNYLLYTGIIPINNASKKATMMNMIFSVVGSI
jgi:hypothetical protein